MSINHWFSLVVLLNCVSWKQFLMLMICFLLLLDVLFHVLTLFSIVFRWHVFNPLFLTSALLHVQYNYDFVFFVFSKVFVISLGFYYLINCTLVFSHHFIVPLAFVTFFELTFLQICLLVIYIAHFFSCITIKVFLVFWFRMEFNIRSPEKSTWKKEEIKTMFRK